MRFIPQLDETDCGAACLAMIGSHYKMKKSLTSIREIAGTDRDGTNLAGLIKAASILGFQAKALRGTAEALDPSLPVPFIAHVRKVTEDAELLHYVVVAKIGKDELWIYDPGEGKLVQKRSTFLEQWTGYVVFLSPQQDFVPRQETQGLFSRFLPLLKPHVRTLSHVAIATFLLIIFGIVGSLYFRYLIDEVLFSRAEMTLHVLSIGILAMTLFQVLLEAVRKHLLLHFSMKVDLTLIFSYFRHVLRLPIGFFDSRKTGEILSRMDDAQKIRNALSEASVSVVMDTWMVVIIGIVLFFQSSTLFWIAVLTLPLSTLMIWLFSKPFSRRYRRMMAETSEVHSYLVETINGSGTVKALNAENLVFHEYEKKQMKAVRTTYKLGIFQNIQGILIGLIDGWGSNVLFWLGSFFILQNQLSLGQLISFNALLGYFIGPLKRLLNLQPSLQEAFVAADRLGEILDIEEEIPEEGRWVKPLKFRGDIVVRNLSFRYGTRRLILDGLDFTIGAGERVAFVGSSGSGKSTLVKMLLKFYQPEKGEILLDGNNLEDVDTRYLRSKIGYVPQEIFLFSGSISDNIALHNPDASLEEIVDAAQRAQAHDFIVQLPERYNTILAERGASLSGGERQRLALARALLGQPDFLIFDEATSNLDSISEQQIHRTMETLKDDRITTILIAHRLTTVVGCDRIFVVDRGRVVEQGRHEQLLEMGGLYRQMWEGTSL